MYRQQERHLVILSGRRFASFMGGGLLFFLMILGAIQTAPDAWAASVVTHLHGTVPQVQVQKSDLLVVDGNGNGEANAGDRLRYTVVIANRGMDVARSLLFTDVLDVNTTLITNTVQTTAGTVTVGNQPNDKYVSVAIAALNAQRSAIITFDAQINTSLPLGLNRISNQGTVTGLSLPPVLTDDSDTDDVGDATVTLLVPVPDVQATMTSSLVTDQNSNQGANPGDVVEYLVTITNRGRRAALDMFFDLVLDPQTTLVNGTVTTTRGNVVSGNNSGDTSVRIEVGILAAGNDTATIRLRALINDPLPQATAAITARGTISSPDLPQIKVQNTTEVLPNPVNPTPDPSVTPNPTPIATPSPTITPSHLPRVTMEDFLFIDTDGDEQVSVDDILIYQIVIENSSADRLTGVNVQVIPDENTSLIVGSVRSISGTVQTGNRVEDTDVRIDIGPIPRHDRVVISFQTRINNVGTIGLLSTQATISLNDPQNASNTPLAILSDDPATPDVNDPTQTPARARSGRPRQALFLPMIRRE